MRQMNGRKFGKMFRLIEPFVSSWYRTLGRGQRVVKLQPFGTDFICFDLRWKPRRGYLPILHQWRFPLDELGAGVVALRDQGARHVHSMLQQFNVYQERDDMGRLLRDLLDCHLGDEGLLLYTLGEDAEGAAAVHAIRLPDRQILVSPHVELRAKLLAEMPADHPVARINGRDVQTAAWLPCDSATAMRRVLSQHGAASSSEGTGAA